MKASMIKKAYNIEVGSMIEFSLNVVIDHENGHDLGNVRVERVHDIRDSFVSFENTNGTISYTTDIENLYILNRDMEMPTTLDLDLDGMVEQLESLDIEPSTPIELYETSTETHEPKAKKEKKTKDTYIKVVGNAPKVIIKSKDGHETLAYRVSQKAKRKGDYKILQADQTTLETLFKDLSSDIVNTLEFYNYARTITYSAIKGHFTLTGFEVPQEYHEDLHQETLTLVHEAYHSQKQYSINVYINGKVVKDQETNKNMKQMKSIQECTTWNELHNLCYNRTLQAIGSLFKQLRNVKDNHDQAHQDTVESYTQPTTQFEQDINRVLKKHLTEKQFDTWVQIAHKERNGIRLTDNEYKVKERIIKRMQKRLETKQATETELYKN